MTQNATQQSSMSAQQAFAKHLAQHAYVNNPFTQQAASANITPVTSVLHPLNLAMPVLRAPAVQNTQSTNNYSNSLSLFSSMDSLNLAHAAVRNAQQSSSNALPAVDMLVLPTSTALNEEPCHDVVKVSYTTAEDLAESLFPTSAAHKELSSRVDEHAKYLKDLSTHRDLVHDGLLDHKTQVRRLHKSMNMVDTGLIDHRVHIKKLNEHMSHADEGLLDHRKHITKLNDHMSLADEGLLDHRYHIDKLNRHMSYADEGLLDHRNHLRSLRESMLSVEDGRQEHSKQIASLDEHQQTTDKALAEHQSHILKLQNDNVNTSMQLKRTEAEMNRLASEVKSFRAGSKTDDKLQEQVQQLKLDNIKMHKGLMQHTNALDAHHEVLQQLTSTKAVLQQSQQETTSQITHLSKSLDSTRKALQQSQQDTSSQISNLNKTIATRNVEVLQAPRRR